MTNRRDFRLDEKLGLDREESAARVGVGVTLFDAMVADGRMPQPHEIGGRTVWDREEVDSAFKALPKRQAKEPVQAAVTPEVGTRNPWNRGRDQAA